MTKKERTKVIDRQLEQLFPNPKPPLDFKDPYTTLIAVLLSARCTDKRVNQITPALFELADNPLDMSKVPVDKIRKIIRPCGLSPKKSKAISGLSKILIEKYSGQVPQTLEELETLPGVGHKTASVVMVQAFDSPAFPVDTHVHRLAERWKLSNGKNVKQTEKDLKKLYPRESWGKVHLQFVLYGQQICSAKKCDGKWCSVCTKCFGGDQESQ